MASSWAMHHTTGSIIKISVHASMLYGVHFQQPGHWKDLVEVENTVPGLAEVGPGDKATPRVRCIFA